MTALLEYLDLLQIQVAEKWSSTISLYTLALLTAIDSIMCVIQQQSNNEVTAQLQYFCNLLTVLLEYIDLYYALCLFLAGFH